jgi:hypothetical protein
MANEIVVLEQTRDAVFTCVFKYPFATPTQYTGGDGVARNVVPTPSAGLPALAAIVFTSAERAACDAGTLVFEVVAFTADPGLTTAQLTARVKQFYASKLADATAGYLARYAHVGALVSYP